MCNTQGQHTQTSSKICRGRHDLFCCRSGTGRTESVIRALVLHRRSGCVALQHPCGQIVRPRIARSERVSLRTWSKVFCGYKCLEEPYKSECAPGTRLSSGCSTAALHHASTKTPSVIRPSKVAGDLARTHLCNRTCANTFPICAVPRLHDCTRDTLAGRYLRG